MHVLLTGASGYVGSAVASHLALRGHTITALARTEQDITRAHNRGWSVIACGLEDVAVLREAAARVDGAIHCAASDAPSFLPINARAVEAIADGLPEGAPFISHAGTLLFGDTGQKSYDGSEPISPPPFLVERANLDRQILATGSRLRTAVVYAALAYGGRGAAIPNALIAAGRSLGYVPYPGTGDQVWTTVSVGDWASLIVIALEQTPPGSRRYIAVGAQATIREVAAAAANALGVSARPVNGQGLEALHMFGLALALNQRFDGRLGMALGWRPAQNALQQGMDEAVRAPLTSDR